MVSTHLKNISQNDSKWESSPPIGVKIKISETTTQYDLTRRIAPKPAFFQESDGFLSDNVHPTWITLDESLILDTWAMVTKKKRGAGPGYGFHEIAGWLIGILPYN